MVLRELINLIGFEVDEGATQATEDKVKGVFSNIKEYAEVVMHGIESLFFFKAAEKSVDAFSEWAMALAEVRQRLLSTGNAAGKTTEELAKMAEELTDQKNFFGDDQFLQAEAEMLKFREVTGDTFDEAIKLSADLAAAMKTDVSSAAQFLGKSLNYPGQSLRTLALYGIQFSKQEQKNIEIMVESGRRAEAQKLLLDSLRRSIGGTAAALYEAEPGWAKVRKEMNLIADTMGEILYPAFQAVLNTVKDVLHWFRELPKETKETIIALSAIATAITTWKTIVPLLMMILKVAILPLIGAFGWWLPIIAAVGAAIFLLTEDFLHFVHGGKSFIGQFIEPWKTLGPKVMAFIQPIIDYAKEVFSGFIGIVKGMIQIAISIFTGNTEKAKKGIRNFGVGAAKIVEGVLVGLTYLAIAFINFILYKLLPNLIKIGVKLFRDFVFTIAEVIKTGVGDAIQWVVSKLEKIPGAKKVIDFITNIKGNYQSATAQQSSSLFPDWNKDKNWNETKGAAANAWGTLSNPSTYVTFEKFNPEKYSLNNMANRNYSGKSNNIQTHNEINITVPPGTSKEQADYIARQVDDRLSFHTRQVVTTFNR